MAAWTGATNNVTNWFCIHMDTVYTAVYTSVISHEGLVMAASGILFFPLPLLISIPPHCPILSNRCTVADARFSLQTSAAPHTLPCGESRRRTIAAPKSRQEVGLQWGAWWGPGCRSSVVTLLRRDTLRLRIWGMETRVFTK